MYVVFTTNVNLSNKTVKIVRYKSSEHIQWLTIYTTVMYYCKKLIRDMQEVSST